MDYFSKFIKGSNRPVRRAPPIDYAQEFHKSWEYVNVCMCQTPLTKANVHFLEPSQH